MIQVRFILFYYSYSIYFIRFIRFILFSFYFLYFLFIFFIWFVGGSCIECRFHPTKAQVGVLQVIPHFYHHTLIFMFVNLTFFVLVNYTRIFNLPNYVIRIYILLYPFYFNLWIFCLTSAFPCLVFLPLFCPLLIYSLIHTPPWNQVKKH